MIKINIIAVGKVKEKYFSDGINEYSKRLSAFCEFKIVEITEETFKKADASEIVKITEREADRIIPFMKGFNIIMAIDGKQFASEGFARLLKELTDKGIGVINFIIGGSYGLSKRIKDKADLILSFSQLTFPHTLFRLILSEQIYRAFSINAGSAYHK